jgi:hypothetical protein
MKAVEEGSKSIQDTYGDERLMNFFSLEQKSLLILIGVLARAF